MEILSLIRCTFLFTIIFLLSASKSVSPIERQKEDFQVFKEVLLKKEGTLDLHTDLNVLRQSLDKLEKDMLEEKSLIEQYKLYSRLLSLINCGHTQIHPNRPVLKEWLAQRNSLPIDYYLIGKRLVVNRLLKDDDRYIMDGRSNNARKRIIPTSSEIISIDNMSVPEMMEGISEYLSSDEGAIDFKYYQASYAFDFYRHLAFPFSKDSIQVKYVYKDDTSDIYLETGAAPVNTMNKRIAAIVAAFNAGQKDQGKFRILNGKYGYFRFTSFQSSSGKSYEKFLEQSFKILDQRNIGKLIIDLRGNTGGSMQYSLMRYFIGEGKLLGRYVVEKPKHRFENKYLKKFSVDYFQHKRLSAQQRREIRRNKFDNGRVYTDEIDNNLIYQGEIIVITDEGTFSSAAILACHLKTMCGAKILGATPGGSFYAGNAGSIQLGLPNSKLHVFINPNTFYSHLEPPMDPLKIKRPDIEIDKLIIDKGRRDKFFKSEAIKAF